MRLILYEFRTGAETAGRHRVVYDVANDSEPATAAAHVEGHALVWQLDDTAEEADGALLSRRVQLDPFADWIVRCDRIDFPPGGVAYTHTHPGPGIRYLLHGELDIRTEGRIVPRTARVAPGSRQAPSRCSPQRRGISRPRSSACMLLPAEWAGKRTIRYVDPADEDRPKLQRPTVYLEHPLSLT